MSVTLITGIRPSLLVLGRKRKTKPAARQYRAASAEIAAVQAERRALARFGVPELAEQRREIDEALGDDMDHLAFALHAALAFDELRAHDDAAITLEDAAPHHDVGDPSLVLERHEDDAAGGAGLLAHEHEPRHPHPLLRWRHLEAPVPENAPRVERIPQQRHGMAFEREPERRIILDHFLTQPHGRQDGR